MKKSERRMILMLIIIGIIIIAILVKVKNGKTNENPINEEQQNEQIEEFVEVSEDGTKVNKSEKLAETKTFENYEISNIQLTENEGQSLLLADVKNIGDAKTDVRLIDITLLDKEGNEITTIGGIVGEIEPGQVVQLNSSATADFANAYDFTIKTAEQQ